MVSLRSRNRIGLAHLACSLALLVTSGCQDDGRPHVVTAEFTDENHDGVIQPGETIRLGLDRPLPAGYLTEIRPEIELGPSAPGSAPSDTALNESMLIESIEWTASAGRGTEIVLTAESVGGEAQSLVVRGAGGEGQAVRLRARFGREAPGEWIDLTYLPSHPVLERVLWEDRHANLAVDEGDLLRLVFDRPVTLRRAKASRIARVRVPEDLRLVSDTDRLDDGQAPSRFEVGEVPEEILVILGSRPLLTIDGVLAADGASLELRPPSALAVNGTRIFPARRIVEARGGWGAISTRVVDIDFAPESRRWRPVEAEFPPPGHRTDHTVTPLPHDRALIVGGRAVETGLATDQVLIFDPAALDRGENPFRGAADRLPSAAAEHTTTLLAGPDAIPLTDDDLVVVIGGTDDEDQVLDTITVFAMGEDGDPHILRPPAAAGPAPRSPRLRVPRWEHASVAVGPLRVLVDGGRTRGPSGLVGCAELLTFEVHDDGYVALAEHTVFRSIPRIQHSLTPLSTHPAEKQERYVLAYGGYGQYRLQQLFLERREESLGEILYHKVLKNDAPDDEKLPADVYFTDDDLGTVLVSPVLIDLEEPQQTTVLKYGFNFPLLRRGHVAVPLADGPETETTVLIAGGTSAHLEELSRNRQRGWEIPGDKSSFEGELTRRLSRKLPITPRGYEAGNAVLFHFDQENPGDSRFSVVPHPAPDSQMIERLYQACAVVPGTGVLLLGGEQQEADGPKELRVGDIFLEGRQLWRPMAPSLTRPRSGHEAYVVGKDGIPTVYVIGGHTDTAAEEEAPFPAVEELRLR